LRMDRSRLRMDRFGLRTDQSSLRRDRFKIVNGSVQVANESVAIVNASSVFGLKHLNAMSSPEHNVAKRRCLDDSNLRPGVGAVSWQGDFEKHDCLHHGLGALPVQPLYEAIEQSTYRLKIPTRKRNPRRFCVKSLSQQCTNT
jgi:hypothetical protein